MAREMTGGEGGLVSIRLLCRLRGPKNGPASPETRASGGTGRRSVSKVSRLPLPFMCTQNHVLTCPPCRYPPEWSGDRKSRKARRSRRCVWKPRIWWSSFETVNSRGNRRCGRFIPLMTSGAYATRLAFLPIHMPPSPPRLLGCVFAEPATGYGSTAGRPKEQFAFELHLVCESTSPILALDIQDRSPFSPLSPSPLTVGRF